MIPVSLALGGGGIRGIAHLGVIRRLEQAGFCIAALAGTSVGALVGAVYAAGYSPDELEKSLLKLDNRNIFRRERGDGPSLLGLGGVRTLLEGFIGNRIFSDLKIPFACTAVDLISNTEIVINRGSLMQAVQASAAVPGVFPAIEIQGMQLVDGGILDPVPVSVARWLAPKLPVIAVCLNPPPEEWAEMQEVSFLPQPPLPASVLEQVSRLRFTQALKIFSHSMDLSSRMLAEMRMKVDQPDAIIRPDVGHVGMLDMIPPQELEAAGYLAAEKALDEIHTALTWRKRLTRQFRSAALPGRVLDNSDFDDDSSASPEP